MEYTEFLKSKTLNLDNSGFKTQNLNSGLYEFQSYVTELACKKGKFGVFAGTGTGKTLMQCECANQYVKQFNKPSLILAPLAVSLQTINESAKFGIEVKKYNGNITNDIFITNYDNLHNVDIHKFDSIILDEASIIKHYQGKFRDLIIDVSRKKNYKLAFTATPSPNDIMELGNYSEFLSVLNRNEMLAKYFIHDSGNTSQWRLKRHGVNKFFEFLTQWSIMFQSPKDIGFDDDRFVLPELQVNEIFIETPNNTESLFNDVAISAIYHNKAMRDTLDLRLDKVADIANNSNKQIIIWVKLNDEEKILKKLIPGAVVVNGSDSIESKEENLIGFANNKFRVLITKPKIAQFGLNFQNCSHQIFASPDYSFESLYQAIRRSYRYGQKEKVVIDIIGIDRVQNVLKALKNKEKSFNELQNNYKKIYNKGNQ